jgi:23S rRNA (uridine2552-2'-O)-methyltransferase
MATFARRRATDIYTRMAHANGYPARSVYKLEEIHSLHRIIRRGMRCCMPHRSITIHLITLMMIDMRVLDLGCAPGSWTMWAAAQVGARGHVLAIDIEPLPQRVQFAKHVRVLQQDIYQWEIPV